METEADICKRTGMLTNMIWQLPQTTPLSYLVIFQVAPEPKGESPWELAGLQKSCKYIHHSVIHTLSASRFKSVSITVGDFTHPWRRRTGA